MARREHMLGIAEKLPKSKSPVKLPKAPLPRPRRRIVALDNRLRKRR